MKISKPTYGWTKKATYENNVNLAHVLLQIEEVDTKSDNSCP